jgi:hypothetical protein
MKEGLRNVSEHIALSKGTLEQIKNKMDKPKEQTAKSLSNLTGFNLSQITSIFSCSHHSG